jgi:hypothetical protein
LRGALSERREAVSEKSWMKNNEALEITQYHFYGILGNAIDNQNSIQKAKYFFQQK